MTRPSRIKGSAAYERELQLRRARYLARIAAAPVTKAPKVSTRYSRPHQWRTMGTFKRCEGS